MKHPKYQKYLPDPGKKTGFSGFHFWPKSRVFGFGKTLFFRRLQRFAQNYSTSINSFWSYFCKIITFVGWICFRVAFLCTLHCLSSPVINTLLCYKKTNWQKQAAGVWRWPGRGFGVLPSSSCSTARATLGHPFHRALRPPRRTSTSWGDQSERDPWQITQQWGLLFLLIGKRFCMVTSKQRSSKASTI